MEKVNPIKRPSTLNELAYKEIRNSLITGRLQFDKIYSANYFAEILEVSRTPVREALLQLTNEGCFISLQGQGFKIKEYSAKEVSDFFETRKMIESYVAERVVGSLTEPELRQLEDCFKSMVERRRDRGDTYGFLEADRAFHMNLVHRYNNFLLVSIMQNIRNLISIFGGRASPIESGSRKSSMNIKSSLRRSNRGTRKKRFNRLCIISTQRKSICLRTIRPGAHARARGLL